MLAIARLTAFDTDFRSFSTSGFSSRVRPSRRVARLRWPLSALSSLSSSSRCTRPEVEAKCKRLSCVDPKVCKLLGTDYGPLVELMKQSREVEGVRKALVASGVRMDLAQQSPEYLEELAAHHVGGHLKVAPEHTDPEVLHRMKKPEINDYQSFDAALQAFRGGLIIRLFSEDREKVHELVRVVGGHRGPHRLFFEIDGADGRRRRVRSNERHSVRISTELAQEIEGLLGSGRTKLARI